MLTAAQIAQALNGPFGPILANWPTIEMELAAIEGFSDKVQIAAAATVHVENPTFTPKHEKYNGTPQDYFKAMYWDNAHVREMLGNLVPEDSWKYCGRGYVQLSGRSNYRDCGNHIGVDLLGNPDLALQPDISAKIFAWFFTRCYLAANQGDWTHVRKLVNGGENGLANFLSAVTSLQNIAKGATA